MIWCLCFCDRRPSHKVSDASLVVVRFNSFILILAYLSLVGLVAYWSRLGKETPRGWFVCVRFIRDNTQEGVCWLSVWYYQTREGAYLLFGLSSTRYPRRVLSSFGFSLSSTTLQECRVTPCFGGLVKKLTSFAYCLFGVSSLLVCLILGIHRNSWDCLFLFDSNGTTSVVVWLHTGLDTTNPSRVR